ncbi:SDR family NAD(P)-dependent oxidoreductase [Algivirga pacifica]|uniref:SDR family NAD(P)-dependent oxidoreductase n=1 Tax=Algivirga pacifica TaxID=1162670 RepID=A0ABP9DAG2_9BACT
MKTILITGSTDGIGKLAATKLAQDGHHLYLHGRNANKLEETIKEIKQLSHNNHIKGFLGDLSDLADTRRMAHQIKQELDTLDVLINNAGVYKSPTTQNQAGLDLRFVVNYFAPVLLTHELLPLLEKGKNPRIINLSSAAQGAIDYDMLKGKTQGDQGDTYAQSKLALTMWSFDLAKTLKDITVIPVNPGSLLNTRMVKEAFGRFWSPADKGGDILYDLAVSKKYEGITGQYFDNDQGDFGTAHPDAYDEDKIQQLLEVTNEIVTG